MPMDATPREQLDTEAEATNCTVGETVAPFEGLLTATVANADAVRTKTIKNAKAQNFIKSALARHRRYVLVGVA